MTVVPESTGSNRDASPWRSVGIFLGLMPHRGASVAFAEIGQLERPVRPDRLSHPIAYCLVASLDFGGFLNTEFVRHTAESFGVGAPGGAAGAGAAVVVAVAFWAKRGAVPVDNWSGAIPKSASMSHGGNR